MTDATERSGERVLALAVWLWRRLFVRGVSMTWQTVLQPYGNGRPPLLDRGFVAHHGSRAWAPVDDDKHAAAKLHIQLVSRISTQPLPYLDGVEKAALDSLYSLFETTRKIGEKHPDGHQFDTLAWHVLNTHLRPFTAKWHRESVRGSLAALDATDQFRAELRALQTLLIEFDRLLLHLRDDRTSLAAAPPVPSVANDIVTEMGQPVGCEIRQTFSGIADSDLQARQDEITEINKAERAAVERRRGHYGITGTTGAAGLALSGGGIRSATFSLGVLIALAERGLLRQFDYLSTVSGGGYLGSFLSVFLQSNVPNVGLKPGELPFKRDEGEAAALRHIRHHSKYLVTGSVWDRGKALTSQLYGMFLNGLAVTWIVLGLALVERVVATMAPLGFAASWWRPALVVFAIVASLSLLLLRFRKTRRYADDVLFWPVALIAALAACVGLGALRDWLPTAASRMGAVGNPATWVAILGAVPTAAPVLQAIAPRIFARLGVLVTALSTIAAPLFVLALYFYISSPGLTTSGTIIAGTFVPYAVLSFALGGLVYFVVFDVNMTSPHRYYRRKLAAAYLIQPIDASARTFRTDVAVRLSDLTCDKAPYPLINCALNVPSSTNANMQGRLTDFFLFSPKFCGSSLIGYAPTADWEACDPHLDVGTAMAISGAAASPQMGTGTIPARARFWLALLNVRLGYWVRQPNVRRWMPGPPGIRYLVKEMLGSMHERSRFINLSDGGHIENLGIYELLRRRCKFVVAIDGEQDVSMTFHGLTTLQRLAAIDLGVHIDIDLDDLRLDDRGLSRSHFRFCRIRYPRGRRGSPDDFGYLLYLKLSLTGNEGEFIRRYRLDEPAFPHHSTADQMFSEAQFEAYRSLGEHVGSKLFLEAIVGPLAKQKDIPLEAWFQELGRNLLSRADRER